MKPYEKLLKENLTIEEWYQWLEETPEKEKEYELSYFINYHLNADKKNKIEFPTKLNITEHKSFVKGYLYFQDYNLYYVLGYKTIYNTNDMSTEEQLSELGFTERQREFIIHWEETPFIYNKPIFDEFYDELMNGVIPVSMLINLYFEYINE